MHPLASLVSIVATLQVGRLVAASCEEADGSGNGFPCNGLRFNVDTPCGVDPHDASDFEFQMEACACFAGATYTAAITYTDVNGLVQSETASIPFANPSTASTLSFDYPVANTNTLSDSQVTININNGFIAYPAESYKYSPVTSIFFTEATTTATVPAAVDATVTITSSITSTATDSITPVTVSKPCTTGTATVTAKTCTKTVTSTITPTPKTTTSTKTQITTSTTHLSCYPAQPSKQPTKHPRDRVARLAERQYNVGTFEQPYCPEVSGDPVATTYTTATEVDLVTTTATVSTTVFPTMTTTVTILPTPATTTVCSNVQATTTTTPTTTRTSYSTIKQCTQTNARYETIYETIFPLHAKTCPTPKSNAVAVPKIAPQGPVVHPVTSSAPAP